MKKLAFIVGMGAFALATMVQAADSTESSSPRQTVRAGQGDASAQSAASTSSSPSTSASTRTALSVDQAAASRPVMAVVDSRPAVPSSVSAISNPEMRKAISDHSPNYDDLGRGSQVFTYVHVYKSMNDGLMPAISEDDLDLIYRIEPVNTPVESDAVRHYDATPSILMDNTQPAASDWTNNYERYITDRDLSNQAIHTTSNTTTTR